MNEVYMHTLQEKRFNNVQIFLKKKSLYRPSMSGIDPIKQITNHLYET